uniref:Cationic amino acid transporter C-terminal domain-containing protein n=1 Tax=Nelumbo nucifera TaxID=4432 RepID=A0A822Z162_NELNU|nr:TPA_asm: hypothetical protein HUJ06_007880 [Nelumbo nucifera]
MAALWALDESRWVAYLVVGILWLLTTLGIRLFVPHARNPKLWGVPLVPWLPSASFPITIFLLGSIDGKSYTRFAMWTGLLLLYYFFFGLHASYDTAK